MIIRTAIQRRELLTLELEGNRQDGSIRFTGLPQPARVGKNAEIEFDCLFRVRIEPEKWSDARIALKTVYGNLRNSPQVTTTRRRFDGIFMNRRTTDADGVRFRIFREEAAASRALPYALCDSRRNSPPITGLNRKS